MYNPLGPYEPKAAHVFFYGCTVFYGHYKSSDGGKLKGNLVAIIRFQGKKMAVCVQISPVHYSLINIHAELFMLIVLAGPVYLFVSKQHLVFLVNPGWPIFGLGWHGLNAF